jgi:superfamily II DNA or RNA helicase
VTGQLPLREYQEAALSAVRASWARGVQRPAVVAPTGAGKTVMFSHLIKDELTALPDMRAIVLVHRDELADQAIDKIRQVAPDLHVGKVKADENEIMANVVVASVQTLARPHRLQQLMLTEGARNGGPFGLVIVDEAHHAVAPTWRRVLEELGAFGWSDAAGDEIPQGGAFGPNVVGFSATLARGDGVGLGSVWQEVAYAISLTRLIRRGHLADVRGVRVTVDDLDLAGVRRSGGDYQAGALGTALEESSAAIVITEAYTEHAKDRPGVVFTPTVATAEAVADRLNDNGITAAMVTGTTPRDDRRRIYDEFRTGLTQVLVNCMVLTEGFDAPWASCAVIARPTQSAPLYTQMVGRVLRPWPGKTDALVLDVGASGLHKLATLIDLEPGAVRVIGPDQYLSDAVEEAELASIADEVEREEYARQSGITAKDVDLFAASRSVWLRTDAGVWFVPTATGEFFLWPSSEPGFWDACYAANPVRGAKPVPWERLHERLSLELAMSWAQVEAEEQDGLIGTISRKDASWRRGNAAASEAQVSYLQGLGYRGETTGLSKKDASDLISIAKASKKFDRHYRRTLA